MSNRSKGMKFEREYEQILINQGYVVQRVKGGTKWNKNTDFFGLFDLIAFDHRGWLLVQVKSTFRNKVLTEIQDWIKKNNPPNTKVIYAIRLRGARWRIVECS